MAELDSYAGYYHVLFDNQRGGPALRRGYQIWKHDTEDVFIHVGRGLRWNVSKKTDFDRDTSRTRDNDFNKLASINFLML